MDNLMKKVDVLAIFRINKIPMPYRFKIEINDELITVDVMQVMSVKRNTSFIDYECMSELYGRVRRYFLHYSIRETAWFITKFL